MILKALEISQVKDFVSELEDGLHSYIEQGGENFSGGQKQHLAIARSLEKDVDIYLMTLFLLLILRQIHNFAYT